MKLLLINPPSPFLEHSKCEPPLGLLYLAGAVEVNHPDVQVKILDLGDTSEYEYVLLQTISKLQPDIVGVTCVTPQYKHAKHVCSIVRSNSKALLIVGGPHVSCLPTSLPADCVVTGPGEQALCEIIRVLKLGKQPDTSYMGFKFLPLTHPYWYPSRSLIDLGAYSRRVGGLPATTMITSWGCPSNCHYCAKTVWKKFKLFPADYVCKELDDLSKRFGFKAVLFVDDTFTYDVERLKLICAKTRSLGMIFRCWTRVDCVTPEVLKVLKDGGCVEISFGIESGSQKLLDVMNKQTTVEQNRQALTWAKESGIVTKAFLMVGIPGETRETVEETKRLIAQCDPDQFILSTFTPIVGSPVWFDPERYGIVGFDRWDFEHQWEVGNDAQGGVLINTKWLSSNELQQVHDELLEFLQKRKER